MVPPLVPEALAECPERADVILDFRLIDACAMISSIFALAVGNALEPQGFKKTPCSCWIGPWEPLDCCCPSSAMVLLGLAPSAVSSWKASLGNNDEVASSRTFGEISCILVVEFDLGVRTAPP